MLRMKISKLNFSHLRKCKVNEYLLFLVKNELIFINLNRIFKFSELNELLGVDYKDIINLVNEKEKVHINYLILNSVSLSNIITDGKTN
jgi:hypothetical protein